MAFNPGTVDDRIGGMVVSKLMAENPKDAGTFTIELAFKTPLSFSALVSQVPTPSLYAMRDFIDKTLAKRSDAKR